MNMIEAERKARTAAAVYLEMRGYAVIEQNFRRPRATIDVAAEKNNVMYFIEVSYQRNDTMTTPTESLSAAKHRYQLHAAQVWTEEYKWLKEYHLGAIEIAGDNFVVMNFTDNIS